jgi:hypothetical protein
MCVLHSGSFFLGVRIKVMLLGKTSVLTRLAKFIMLKAITQQWPREPQSMHGSESEKEKIAITARPRMLRLPSGGRHLAGAAQ